MNRTALPALALLLAGCAVPAVPPSSPLPEPPLPLEPLTEAAFGWGPFHALTVRSFDGTHIHVDVQLPKGQGPFPVLVRYTPYSADGDNVWGALNESGLADQRDRYRLGLADEYVPRGYAVAVAHVRGTGESGGCLTVGGPEEGLDGVAVVEFLAGQPWSSGKLAMMGGSYVGTTPIETAVHAPPHLTTILPMSPVTEWYRYYFELGEQRANGDPPLRGSSATDPVDWILGGVRPGPRTLATGGADDATCPLEYTAEYELQDDYDTYWKDRDIREHAGNITASVLYAQGWKDENVATSMLPGFWGAVQSEKRAWFAQHGHGVPRAYKDYYEYEHRWLDHWLLGKRNGALLLPEVLVQDNLGGWRAEATWPPPDARPLRLWLGERALAWEAPQPGEASYRDDGTGREDAQLEGRNHLRFASEPLVAPLHVAGSPRLHLAASSDSTDTQWDVLLYDRAENGSEQVLTRGYLDARHRGSLERGEDLVPGRTYAFEWPLHPRDHAVRGGHRLVLVVKSTDSYVLPDRTRATNTVQWGPEGSWLELPVVDDTKRTYADASPAPWS